MRELRPRGRWAVLAVIALVLMTALLASSQHGALAGYTVHRRRATPPVRVVRHLPPRGTSPLEMLTLPPDGRGAPGRRTTLTASSRENPGDGSFWPDSSSPVRDAPSNATTGPAPSTLPSFPGWHLAKVVLADGNRQRYYLVARPADPGPGPLPLLVVLPGRDMTPARIARASNFPRLVGRAVVAYPAGFANSWNAGYCCGVAHLAGINDVAFIEEVIRNVLATQPGTSPRQVYLVGFSNGGRMVLDMACADPGAFAGIAAVEAVPVSSCARTVPVPLLDIAYTRDPLLTLSEGARPKHIAGHAEITVGALMEQWQTRDGCTPATRVTSYPAMTLTQWSSCRGAGRVAEAVYQGGRHAWPHGAPGTPPAQAVIWAFFHDRVPTAPPERGAAA